MDYPKSDPKIGLHEGKFTDGTEDGQVLPSIDPASWANAVTDEILAVIAAAEMEPDEANTHQLRDAIEIIIAANMTAGTMPVIGKDAAYTATAADLTKVIEATANTWTLGFDPAADLRDGWWCVVRNAGTGTITLDPNGAETIDAAATVQLASGMSCFVVCDGTKLRTIGRSGSGRSAGEVFWTRAATPPTGSLKANGAAVLREAYSALDAAIYVGDANNATADSGYRCADVLNPATTRSVTGAYIVLPDLRGEFVRGWDDGRGVDAGRALGSAQLDAFQGHWHYSTTGNNTINGGHYHVGRTLNSSEIDDNVRGAVSDGVNGTPRTASETRPRNVALLACIQY